MFTEQKSDGYAKLTTPVFALCIVILAIFVGSNSLVLNSAGKIADDVHKQSQRQLLQNEFARQAELVARDQSQVSNWTATLKALGPKIDRSFIRSEIAEWLWPDFDIDTTIVVGAENEPRVHIHKYSMLKPQTGQALVDANMDLINEAREHYFKNRTKKDGGYVVNADPVDAAEPLYASDIRTLGKEIKIVVAQAILPHDGYIMPDGQPQIMLTTKAFYPYDLDYIKSKLEIPSLSLLSSVQFAANSDTKLAIGKSGLGVTWETIPPSRTIWNEAYWILALLICAVSLGLLCVAIIYARALRALKKSEQRNRFLAMHDALTGLPNRLHLDAALEKVVSNGEQDRCAILCIDLDRFKTVNDVWGHHAGDIVIKTVAKRMLNNIDDAGLVARMGGDEFIVLLKDRLNKNEVLKLCDDLISSICQEIHFEGGSACVGASIGVAWWPDDAKTCKMVIRSADEALYRAKESGRGRAFLANETGAEQRSPRRKSRKAA